MDDVVDTNPSDETLRALEAHSASNHRSTGAEVPAVLDAAVESKERVRLGSLLADIGRSVDGVDRLTDRDATPQEPRHLA